MSTQPLHIYIDSDFDINGKPLAIMAYLRNSLWTSLERYEIFQTSHLDKADFVLTSDKEFSEERGIHPNTVVVESSDGCHFSGKIGSVESDEVIGWLKRYKAESYSEFGGKIPAVLHALATDGEIPEKVYRRLPEQLEKVDIGLSFLYANHIMYEHRRTLEHVRRDESRDIDVFFAGTTLYWPNPKIAQTWPQQLATTHRQSCVSALQQLKSVNSLILDSKSLRLAEYSDALRRSKIVVSPWGFGESCYRDYEALLYGCDVIKPSTPYRIKSRPDIYRTGEGSWLRWTKPDWSDIGDVVEQSLSEWHQRQEFRHSIKNTLIDSLSYDYQAEQLSEVFNRIVDRQSAPSNLKAETPAQSAA